MSMIINTRQRSTAIELMDDFAMEGEELKDALDRIAWINKMLGGNSVTIKAVERITWKRSGVISITDIGCGNGDMLRQIANSIGKGRIAWDMTGIDANPFTIGYARQLSADAPDTQYVCADVLDPYTEIPSCDIILLTLTLHHFSDDQILELLGRSAASARLAIIVNDLERSWLSYALFSCLGKVMGLGAMNTNDGKISILRGFKRRELEHFAKQLNFKQYHIRWRWAFRYQWIIHPL